MTVRLSPNASPTFTEEERRVAFAPAISGYSSLIPTLFHCTLTTHKQEHSRKVRKKADSENRHFHGRRFKRRKDG